MITMLHYDALQNPTQTNRKGVATSIAQAQTYLEQHPYDIFEENDLFAVSKMRVYFIKYLPFFYFYINTILQEISYTNINV